MESKEYPTYYARTKEDFLKWLDQQHGIEYDTEDNVIYCMDGSTAESGCRDPYASESDPDNVWTVFEDIEDDTVTCAVIVDAHGWEEHTDQRIYIPEPKNA